MTVVLPQGFAQFTLRWSSPNFASGGAATVLGFGRPGEPVAAASAFAQNIIDYWIEYLKPVTDSGTSLASVYWATDVASGEIAANEPGAQNVDNAPPQVAALMTYRTAAKGPRGRGRSYWPSLIPRGELTEDGLMTQSRVDSLAGRFDDFFETLLLPDDSDQVVLQRDEPGQQSPPLNPPPIVTSRILQRRVATQRRRNRR